MTRPCASQKGHRIALVTVLLAMGFLFAPRLPARSQTPVGGNDAFDTSVGIIVETLDFLDQRDETGRTGQTGQTVPKGQKPRLLSARLLEDIKAGKITVRDLSGKGVNAETGENDITLDDGVLELARGERLWRAKKFDTNVTLEYLGWAETIVHEYYHLDQTNPDQVPRFEDPAYQYVARMHVRWYNRLAGEKLKQAEAEKDPATRAAALRQLRGILGQLLSAQSAFKEAVKGEIDKRHLNAHLSFANAGLEARLRKLLPRVDAAIKAADAAAAKAKTTSSKPAASVAPTTTTTTTTVQTGWRLDGSPQIKKSLPTPDACYLSATLDISDGAATGVRAWTDACSNISKCSGTYVGNVTWTKPPAFLTPGQTVRIDATAGTTAQNTCGYKNFGSSVWLTLNGGTFVQAGESQYTGPPKASGTFTVPAAPAGGRLTIEVHIQAASLSGSVVYSYVA